MAEELQCLTKGSWDKTLNLHFPSNFSPRLQDNILGKGLGTRLMIQWDLSTEITHGKERFWPL